MTKKRILAIDDEPDILEVLEKRLTLDGYEVVLAKDGKSGLEKALSQKPDLILLDVAMPDMDGFEVCKRLRSDPATAATPVLMLTARDTSTDEVLGLELGADDYITKPYDH